MKDYKVISDPVHGFIEIPRGLMLRIVQHPLITRLSRIRQLGLTSIVYPGAQHTRFQHSLGAFHLMSTAILSLQRKGTFIFDSEAEAVEAAILMHDIGHGPFSHVLEHTLIKGISHEDISLMMMEQINKDLGGALTLAIKIFKDDYPKQFLHQLISSQLDMDRLDYLARDAFFTGVNEGNIGSARIIQMLDVHDDNLIVDKKGIYTIENYLTSRRSMYWQVYLHKTTVSAEQMLKNCLRRAKELAASGEELFASPALLYFLYNDVDSSYFKEDSEALRLYEALDDNDILTSLKVWSSHKDRILSTLASDLVNRRIFKVKVSSEPFSEEEKEEKRLELMQKMGISYEDTSYFLSESTAHNEMYDNTENSIRIIYKNEQTNDICEVSDLLNNSVVSQKIRKYYLCYQRL